jgi:hypothetical protein
VCEGGWAVVCEAVDEDMVFVVCVAFGALALWLGGSRARLAKKFQPYPNCFKNKTKQNLFGRFFFFFFSKPTHSEHL